MRVVTAIVVHPEIFFSALGMHKPLSQVDILKMQEQVKKILRVSELPHEIPCPVHKNPEDMAAFFCWSFTMDLFRQPFPSPKIYADPLGGVAFEWEKKAKRGGHIIRLSFTDKEVALNAVREFRGYSWFSASSLGLEPFFNPNNLSSHGPLFLKSRVFWGNFHRMMVGAYA